MKKLIIYSILSIVLNFGSGKKIKLDTPLDEGAQYGWSVDMSRDFLVVGGPGYYHKVSDLKHRCGTVLIFKKQSHGSYVFFQRLLPPDPSVQGFFGGSIAINNNDLLIGDALDKLNPKSIGSFDSAGAVYAYRLDENEGEWKFVNKITKNNRSTNDSFGSHISLSDSVAIVTTGGHKRGALFVLKKNEKNEWIIKNTLNKGITEVGDIDLDSNRLIFASDIDLGKEGNSESKNWKVVTSIIDSNGQFSNIKMVAPINYFQGRKFGRSALSICKDFCFVNSYFKPDNGEKLSNRGNVHMFKLDSASGNWIEKQKIVSPDLNKVDFFGNSIDFESGNLIVGAMGDNYNDNNELIEYKGGVYLYRLESDSLILKSEISAPEKAWNKFGFSVVTDNGYVLIGSRLESYGDSIKNAGGAYVYRIEN